MIKIIFIIVVSYSIIHAIFDISYIIKILKNKWIPNKCRKLCVFCSGKQFCSLAAKSTKDYEIGFDEGYRAGFDDGYTSGIKKQRQNKT